MKILTLLDDFAIVAERIDLLPSHKNSIIQFDHSRDMLTYNTFNVISNDDISNMAHCNSFGIIYWDMYTIIATSYVQTGF